MTSTPRTYTFDCADPAAVAAFWSAVTARPVDESPNEYVAAIGMWPRVKDDMAFLFLAVPEPKTAKNRLHIDVRVSSSAQQKDREGMRAKADQLVAAGATLVSVFDEEFTGHWIVMLDPEGNEFCVV